MNPSGLKMKPYELPPDPLDVCHSEGGTSEESPRCFHVGAQHAVPLLGDPSTSSG